MKKLVIASFLLISYFMYGFYINQVDLSVVPLQLKKENPAGFYDYKGVVNIHTRNSIGSSAPSFIVKSAKAAGLDFVMLTDLNQFISLGTNIELAHTGAVVFDARKYSYLDSRLIHYSTKGPLAADNFGEAQVQLTDLLTQSLAAKPDSLLVLAHPFEPGFSWSGEIPEGLDGIEILNLKSLANKAWRESKLSVLWSFLIYPFNSRLALIRLFTEPKEELELFDKISQQRPLVGFGGSEASARAIPLTGYLLKFPSYQRSFEVLSNHVLLNSELTGNNQADRQKLFSALKKGQFYVAFDLIGDPKGFVATVTSKGQTHLMGSQIKFNKDMIMSIKVPNIPEEFFEIILLRNGERYKTYNQPQAYIQITEPGTYRVQVRVSPQWPLPDGKRWVTWIYANPFYIQP